MLGEADKRACAVSESERSASLVERRNTDG
jgi:hypothetical protein